MIGNFKKKKRIGKIGALVIMSMFAVIMLSPSVTAPQIIGDHILMGDDEWIGLGSTDGRIIFHEEGTTDEIEVADARLGIGDTSPDFKLEVTGSSGSGYFGVTSSSDGDIFIIDGSGNVGIGKASPTTKLHVGGSVKIDGSATIDGGLLVDLWTLMVDNTNDRVGIGCPPTAKLQVDGAIKSSSSYYGTILFHGTQESGTPITNGFRLRTDLDYFGFEDAAFIFEKTDGEKNDPDGGIVFMNTGKDGIGEEAMVILGDGNVGIGIKPSLGKLHINAGSTATALYIDNPMGVTPLGGAINVGGGLFIGDDEIQRSSGTLYINEETNSVLVLNKGGGNVGIGISPDAKLHIAGSIKIVDSTERDGYVLTSDANGLASWQNKGVPSGVIVMWSGSVTSLPDGWKLCDGTSGTPDLSGKFIVSYDSSDSDYDAIGDSGGTTTNNIQHSHTYSGTTGIESVWELVDGYDDDPAAIVTADYHTHTYSGTTSNAGSTSLENRPLYYTLAFIIKE
ncbi:MAG: hypothetical protein JSV09_06455 [Thermoplasmata archaeon]|nr:MAG: hypothetical protein JSV09_06455 [Thermoplasmata archaeon]